MIGRSPARTRPQRCSSTRATATASTRTGISPATPGSSRPMPMPALAISMTPNANPARSPRLRAGATAVANSSSSPSSANRHWPSKRCAASTRSSRLSASSMAPPPNSGSHSAKNGSSRLSVRSKDGCSPSAPGYHVTPTLPEPSITCSSAGRPSPAFSTMAASACRTMPPSALCAASLSGAAHGYSLAPTAAVSALPRSIPSSARQNSMASIHRPGLPTYCVASLIIRPPSCTSCCPGTGSYAKPEPLLPDNIARPSPDGYDEAIALHQQAIRLSPRDPQIGYWYHRIGQVHLLQSRIAEAIPWLEKGRSAIPTFPLAYSFLGAAYALNGETERGSRELAETYQLSGKVWVSTIADMKVTGYWGPPKIRALYESVYFAGLRKLGVPEE